MGKKKTQKIEFKNKTVCRDEKLGRCTRRRKCCRIEDGKSACHYKGGSFRLRVGLCAPKKKINKKSYKKMSHEKSCSLYLS